MEALFDILEVLFIIGWILFTIFGTGIFKKKKKDKPRYEYPEFPEDNTPQPQHTEAEVSEEERKLKEWLEETFGVQVEKEPEVVTYQEEPQTISYQIEPEPALSTAFQNFQATDSSIDLTQVAPEMQVEEVESKPSPWQERKLGKRQIAYGLVMAEILQKPRALRPLRRL